MNAPSLPLLELLLFASVGVPALLAVTWSVRPLRGVVTALAPWAAVPALLLALLLLPDPARIPAVEWLGFSTGLRLRVDAIGRAFLLLTALLWVVAGAFARSYHADDEGRDRFFGFFVLTLAGNLGVVLAGDLLTFYLTFAVMTFAAYGLVVHRLDQEAQRAGRVYIVLALIGEAALLAGIFALGSAGGGEVWFGEELAGGWASLEVGLPAAASPGSWLVSAPVVAALLVAGFGVKAGLVPLHLWLPLAHPVAPTAASALLSGAMIKAGLLGWLRVLPGDLALPGLGGALIVLGVASAFYGVIVGLAQDDAKTVLAYSSVSQMGYMAIGTGALLLAPHLAPLALVAIVIYAVHHGVAKGALFLSVGVAGRLPARGQGRWRLAVLVGAALPALALAGAPFTSGAYAKTMLKDTLGELGGAWYAVLDPLLLVAALGTTLLLARFLVVLERDATGTVAPGGERGTEPWGLVVPWAVLVGLGMAAPTWLRFAFPAPAAVASPAPFEGVYVAVIPVAVGAAVALTVMRAPQLLGRLGGVRVPPGDVLVLVEAALGRTALPSGERLARRMRQAGEALERLRSRADLRLAALAQRELLLMRGLSLGTLFALLVLVLAAALAS